MSLLFKQERDTIVGLGLLASTYFKFDPAIQFPSGGSTHITGYNVHCIILDNADGEVLALERNRIFADCNPLQHAEQLAIRAAIAKLQIKRTRPAGMTVSTFYKTQMFMEKGTEPEDYINKGCTLYNTFDPCGMCAVTSLVSYMKRIAFLFDDKTFESVYKDMGLLFKGRDSIKEPLLLVEEGDGPLQKGARLIKELRDKVKKLEDSKVTDLVQTLDHCRDELALAANLIATLDGSHLATKEADFNRNLLTLNGIRRLCNIG